MHVTHVLTAGTNSDSDSGRDNRNHGGVHALGVAVPSFLDSDLEVPSWNCSGGETVAVPGWKEIDVRAIGLAYQLSGVEHMPPTYCRCCVPWALVVCK